MTKQEALKIFLESITWADQCEIKKIIASNQSSAIALQAPNSIYFPCHWKDFHYWKNQCWNYDLKSRPTLLIYGDPPLHEAERIWFDAMKIDGYAGNKCVPLILNFIDVEVENYLAELFQRSTDGINWGKTIVSLLEGGEGIVMDWQ